MKTRLAVFFLMIGLMTCTQLSGQTSHWLQGHWEGTGYQLDGATWEVELNASDLEQISIVYPDLNCSGKWTINGETSHSVKVKERITQGTGNCDQGVEIFLLKIDENKMEAIFYLRTYSEDPIAVARMIRQR